MSPPALEKRVAKATRGNLIVALCFVWLLTLGLAPSMAQQCESIPLSSPLGSLYWPVWHSHGNAILGLDSENSNVVRIQVSNAEGTDFDRAGNSRIGEVQRVEADLMMFSQIGSDVVQLAGDFTDGPITVHRYDQQLRRRNMVELSVASDASRLVAPYSWIASEGHIIGYGLVRSASGDFQLGIFDQTLPLPGSQESPAVSLIHPFNESSFYAAGTALFATVGGQVFYLEMGKFPALYRYDLGMGTPPELILGLPGEDRFTQNGNLQNIGRQGVAELHDFMKSYQGPWSLHEDRGDLLTLNKVRGASSSRWTLHRLSVEGDYASVIGSQPVESNADWLVLLPKPNSPRYLLFEADLEDGEQITHMKVCRF